VEKLVSGEGVGNDAVRCQALRGRGAGSGIQGTSRALWVCRVYREGWRRGDEKA
jgi:hypothetical protein